MSRQRVLIADDDPGVRRSIRRILERLGYEVSVAEDGDDALRCMAEAEFDVLVTDLSMPKTNGMDLVRALRERGVLIPVVLITAEEAETHLAVEALERGVTSYLHKPFAPETIESAVAKALSRSSAVEITARSMIERERGLDRVISSLFVHRQPIVDWPKQTVRGYECLLRAREPSLPHPGAILEAAERFGRLHDLGRAVRRKCTEAPSEDTAIFVNLHPFDLVDPELFAADAPLTQVSHRVVLEITERARLEEIEGARQAIARLRDLGFKVAIDDIGAGFAGLSSLTTFDPDIVKIDMSLVRDVEGSRVKQHLVDTLVRICRDYGIAVVAEGVETPAELDTLLGLGCDLFQGYLFAKPNVGFPEPKWNVLARAS